MIHSNKLYCGLLGDEQSSSFSLARSDWFKLVLAIGLVRSFVCLLARLFGNIFPRSIRKRQETKLSSSWRR